MTGLRKILRVSWAAKKTNEWVLNAAGVQMELLDTVKAIASILWSHYEETRELPGERDNAMNLMPGARRRDHARPGWTTSRRGQDSPWKSQSE